MRPIPTPLCLSLVHTFEGQGGLFEPTRTKDPSGNWEIGWSHKLSGLTDPLWDATLTQADADKLALDDLATAAQAVCDAVDADSLTNGQYVALIDFTYNVGVAAFKASNLCRLVKDGAFHLVPDEFKKWDHAHVDGQVVVLAGLTRRRLAEVQVWLHG